MKERAAWKLMWVPAGMIFAFAACSLGQAPLDHATRAREAKDKVVAANLQSLGYVGADQEEVAPASLVATPAPPPAPGRAGGGAASAVTGFVPQPVDAARS